MTIQSKPFTTYKAISIFSKVWAILNGPYGPYYTVYLMLAVCYRLYGTAVFRNQNLKTDKNVIITPSIKHIEPAINPHGCILSPRDSLTAC